MLPIILSLFLLCSSLHNCSAKDTIPFNGSISDEKNETLVSTGEIFELGFFTRNENSSTYRRYVGIWYYNITPRTVVWVANRDHPLSDGKGSFAITEDGNLQVLDGEENSFWSTAVEISSFNNTSAMLDDSGNLILSDNISGETLWESFGSPTDTFLPGMKMDEGLNLTSWKSSDDPTTGDFVFQRYQSSLDQFVIWKNTLTSYWMSEPGQMPSAIANLLSNSNSTNSISLASVVSKSVKAGAGATVTGNPIKNTFPAVTSCGRGSPYGGSCLPTRNSSSYNHTSCTINNSVRCKCLPGFEPRFLENWGSGYFLNGRKRKTPICGNNTLSVTFMTLKNMKVGEPEGRINARNETNCKTSYCLSDCDCQAYSYDDSNDLKLPSPKKKPLTTIIAITITTVIVLIAASCAIVYHSYLRRIKVAKRRVCETCNTNEFLKCMNVGLLCVQDDPSDRPTMSNVVAVPVSETATLPTPKQPAFLSRRDPSNTASSSSKPEACSIYELTTTDEQGR
ncbi:hypothetical protein L1049_024845 [Liquidambar formosana]|uniref:Bulb-type lectin domain-containing protein n=1 Tax=Liquidambar formosana TaxID=63359 RepID=A0AAP0S1P1_LIQFO